MTNKEFYDYAVECNKSDKSNYNSDVMLKRDVLIRTASDATLRVAELIKSQGMEMTFFRPCLPKFSHYKFTWANIVINNFNIKVFIIEDKDTFGDNAQLNKDFTFIAFKKLDIVILTPDMTDEEIKDQLVRKIGMIIARREKIKNKVESLNAEQKKESEEVKKQKQKRPRIKSVPTYTNV